VFVIEGDMAWLYAWDRAAFEQRLMDANVRRVTRVVPETLLFKPAAGDGARLLQCRDGAAAEYWRDGVLQATRWWPHVPDDAEWSLFLRGAGLPATDVGVPAPVQARDAYDPRGWTRVRNLTEGQTVQAWQSPWLAPVLVAAMTAPAAWLVRDSWVVASELRQLQSQHESLLERASSSLRERAAALKTLEEVEAVQRWLTTPDAIRVVAEVAARLPRDGSIVRRLEVSGDRLVLALMPAPATPRIAYVKALEEGGLLLDVREETSEGREAAWLLLGARLSRPWQETAAPGAEVAPAGANRSTPR
jgi:hypothetical protein